MKYSLKKKNEGAWESQCFFLFFIYVLCRTHLYHAMSTCGKSDHHCLPLSSSLQLRCFPLKSVSQSSWQVLSGTAGLDDSGARLEILFDSTSKQVLQKKRGHTMISWCSNSSFYSWSTKSDGSFLDSGACLALDGGTEQTERHVHQFVEDGCVYLKFNLSFENTAIIGHC